MKSFPSLTALLVCIALTAHSQPGSPATGATVPPPCLSITQRVRLGDSLAMLPQVRKAAVEYRAAATLARRQSLAFGDALVAQQLRTTEASATAADWKHKARKRGLLNYVLLAALGGSAYLFAR